MSTPERVRVGLADDHAMVRQALAQILEEQPFIDVVGQADDAASIAKLVEQTAPDIMILDYSMPGVDTAATIGELRGRRPGLRILILTVHESLHYAVRALDAGAHGYVLKSAALSDLVEAIRAVVQGEIYVSPAVSQKVLARLRVARTARAGLEALSPREFDLLRVLGAGMNLKEAASQLGISPSAASTYRARLMDKLGLQSTAEVIRFALEHDIVG